MRPWPTCTRPAPTDRVMGPAGLDELVEALAEAGYRVVGPTVRDGAIVLDEIASAAELPHGVTAQQDAGGVPARAA